MAASAIIPRLAFGYRGAVKDNPQYAEDGSLIYVAGHNIIIHSVDGKTQKIISGSAEAECITAITVSTNKRLLAVAERAEKAIVTIYDLSTLKKRKTLIAADAGSKDYVSLCFSPDGKTLLAQGGAPEWNLLLWAWEKSKVAATFRTTNPQGAAVFQCSFSPGDGCLISVVGQGILKLFKIIDSSMKQQPLSLTRREVPNFTCQAWLTDSNSERGGERQLLGTADGEVLLVEGTEARHSFACDNGKSVESIVTYSKGFIVGQDGGLVTVFERDDKEVYRRARTFTIHEQPFKVRSLAISPNEEHLACSLDNGAAYTLPISNQELLKVEDMNFEVLGGSYHSAPITGLDVCVRKPWLATCSTDRTVRLWNYQDRCCELNKSFSEEAFSVAIHPTGQMVLVGFADKLRLMTVLMDDLRLIKEVGIKGCKECAFSTGGQLFAAVNGTTISIYNTYTCENVGNLRGHNGKVRSICWAADDTRLVSGGMDGAVYEWRLKDFKRERENVLKGVAFTSVLVTSDSRNIFATGTDKKLKELEEIQGSGTQVVREFETGVALTQLALPLGGRVMFASTESGAVRTYKFPLTGEFTEVKTHAGPVARLKVAFDDSHLFSVGEDGALMAYDVRDKDPAKATARREQERLPWAEEVLVTRSELEDKKTRMVELEQHVAELTMQTEYQLRLKDLHVGERIKELNDKFASELEADKQKYDTLMQDKNEQEMEYEDKLKQAEARAQAQLAALDAQYQAKMMAEVERYQQLLQEKELLNERWDEQNSLLVESHERVTAELTEEYEAKLAEAAQKMEALLNEKVSAERETEEMKRQMEEDADREIEDLKEKYEQKLQQERETGLRLKGENGIMRKNFLKLQKAEEEQKDEIKRLFEEKKDLYATIGGLEKDINGLKREIRERDETIGDKERRIYDLKKKNQELEKFKFVLDYKIKELKKQIEPREEEIGGMREQIKEMDGELERYHGSNAALDLLVANLRTKQAGLQAEVAAQRAAKQEVVEYVKRFQHDLAEAAVAIQDPKALKDKIKVLYQVHGQGAVAAKGCEEDISREYGRQREYLERTVDNLKRKLSKDGEAAATENLRVMQENMALIKEINELRREIKALKQSSCGPGTAGKLTTSSLSGSKRVSGSADNDVRRELEMQREVIARLRDELSQKEARLKQFESISTRPSSRDKLPPMDVSRTPDLAT